MRPLDGIQIGNKGAVAVVRQIGVEDAAAAAVVDHYLVQQKSNSKEMMT